MTTQRDKARIVQDDSKILEQQYSQLFKGSPFSNFQEENNLEQPYFGQVVQTVTTYSVCEKPKLITG